MNQHLQSPRWKTVFSDISRQCFNSWQILCSKFHNEVQIMTTHQFPVISKGSFSTEKIMNFFFYVWFPFEGREIVTTDGICQGKNEKGLYVRAPRRQQFNKMTKDHWSNLTKPLSLGLWNTHLWLTVGVLQLKGRCYFSPVFIQAVFVGGTLHKTREQLWDQGGPKPSEELLSLSPCIMHSCIISATFL